GPPVWTTFSPGTSFKASGNVRSCLRCISSSLMTVMLLPTSFSGVGKRVGVTTSGGSETDDDASAAAAVTGGAKQAIRTKQEATARRRAEDWDGESTALASRQRDTPPRSKVQMPAQPGGG